MKLRYFALAVASLSLVACGGAQQRNARLAPEWPSIADAVPADVSYVLLAPALFAGPSSLGGASAAASTDIPGLPSPGAIIEDLVGIDLNDPSALEQLGIDLGGELAVWSNAVMPVLVARLDDPAEFQGLVERIALRNPDFVRSESGVGAMQFDTLQTPGGWGWDIGVHEGWGVVRLRGPRPEMNVGDELLLRSFRGYAAGDRFVDGLEYADLVGRLGTEHPLRSVFYIETSTFSDGIRAFRLLAADRDRDLDEPELTVTDLYPTEEMAEACALQAERVMTAVPWFGSASSATIVGDRMDSEQVGVMHLGTATAERWADFLGGTFANTAAHAADAAVFGAMNVNIDALHDSIDADPTLMSCPDIAAFSGALGTFRRSLNRRMNTIPRYFDGRFAGALYGVRMAGFAPFVDGAAAIGTTDPTFLMEDLQNTIESAGGNGTVDETSALTTVDYRLLHLRLALSLLDDRVTIRVGDVPTDFVNNASTGAPSDDRTFVQLRVDGEALGPVLDVVSEYVIESGMIPDAQAEFLVPVIEAWHQLRSLTLDARLDADALVFEAAATIAPPAEGSGE